jgi:hypothetical protein
VQAPEATKEKKMRRRWIASTGLILATTACFAGPARAGDGPPTECRAAVRQDRLLADRSATISSLERMPASCLKALLVECSDSANVQLLDLGSAALCSMGYEALLHKGFGGSFHAMLGWWQRDRDSRLVP